MMNADALRDAPFNLDERAAAWVETTLESMTLDVLLFPHEPVEDDIRHLATGIESGRLTIERLDEAVSRMLVLTARERTSRSRPLQISAMLRQRGFEVTDHVPGSDLNPGDFDTALCVLADEGMSGKYQLKIRRSCLCSRRWWTRLPGSIRSRARAPSIRSAACPRREPVEFDSIGKRRNLR